MRCCRLAFPSLITYKPVSYLMGLSEGAVKDIPGLDQALDRFEAAFLKLNSLLKKLSH